jgi:hypothetical protein
MAMASKSADAAGNRESTSITRAYAASHHVRLDSEPSDRRHGSILAVDPRFFFFSERYSFSFSTGCLSQ